jgi:hypothetical protein
VDVLIVFPYNGFVLGTGSQSKIRCSVTVRPPIPTTLRSMTATPFSLVDCAMVSLGFARPMALRRSQGTPCCGRISQYFLVYYFSGWGKE